jgi:hypothetical protein
MAAPFIKGLLSKIKPLPTGVSEASRMSSLRTQKTLGRKYVDLERPSQAFNVSGNLPKKL